MSKQTATFSDGYIAGWQKGSGRNLVPSIPAHSIPAGKTEYDAGYERGYEEGRKRAGKD